MSLLESYDKNKKKHFVDDDNMCLLKEVTAAGDVGAFTGRAGDYIDRKFAGPFHPEFAQLKKLLKECTVMIILHFKIQDTLMWNGHMNTMKR
jgi:hypothetical protein